MRDEFYSLCCGKAFRCGHYKLGKRIDWFPKQSYVTPQSVQKNDHKSSPLV